MSKWATIKKYIQSKSIFQHGSDPNHYSAKASFHFDSFKQGVVLNINKKETISGYVLTKKKSKVLLFLQFALLVICAIALLFQPKTVFLKTCCIFIFAVEFLLFCCFVAVSSTLCITTENGRMQRYMQNTRVLNALVQLQDGGERSRNDHMFVPQCRCWQCHILHKSVLQNTACKSRSA